MAEILHRLQFSAERPVVFQALLHDAFTRGWCTRSTMRLVEAEEGRRLTWRCVDGPDEWLGTDIRFELVGEGETTTVHFVHANWREASDFMAECATKWARALFHLKSYVETPEPDDVQ